MNNFITKYWKKAKIRINEKLKTQNSTILKKQQNNQDNKLETSTPTINRRPSYYLSPITPLIVQNPNSKLKKQIGKVKLFVDND